MRNGVPEIMNADRGSQFTSAEFLGVLKGKGIAISMDGRGQWRDNVFVERLWKSVKYEDVYLRGYLSFYNSRNPHRAHSGLTPDMVYFKTLVPAALVA